MAIYRNYYSRKILSNGIELNWAVIVTCLYLFCSTVNMVNGERVRHQHRMRIHDDTDTENSPPVQLERNQHYHNEDFDGPSASSYSYGHQQPSIIGCPGCHKTLKLETDHLRLEAIKIQILSKLGLQHKPNITHSLPREVVLAMLSRTANRDDSDLYPATSARASPSSFSSSSSSSSSSSASSSGSSSSSSSSSSSNPGSTTTEGMDYDDFYGRTSEIISFAEEGPWISKNRLLEFHVSSELGQFGQEFRIREAMLWIKADHVESMGSNCRSKMYVFKVISKAFSETTTTSQKLESISPDPIIISLEEYATGWQKIDLTDVVTEWLQTESSSSPSINRRDKLRLFVDCSCCTNWHIHLFNNDIDRRNSINRPFLVIHTDPSTTKRVRRRALDCSADLGGNQCCKQRFYVSFKALGWDDWVIAPQGYYANYCRGDCGQYRTPDTFVTYHTHVIQEVRKTQHLSGMQPCCAPLKFSSMSLIYYGPDSNIIKRDLPKMVVDECGCP